MEMKFTTKYIIDASELNWILFCEKYLKSVPENVKHFFGGFIAEPLSKYPITNTSLDDINIGS